DRGPMAQAAGVAPLAAGCAARLGHEDPSRGPQPPGSRGPDLDADLTRGLPAAGARSRLDGGPLRNAPHRRAGQSPAALNRRRCPVRYRSQMTEQAVRAAPPITIEQLDADAFVHAIPQLAELLVDAVDSGATVSFLRGLDHARAAEWWSARREL